MTAHRRSFGSVRKLPSGKWQARYKRTDGTEQTGPVPFASKAAANIWLSNVEVDRMAGSWVDPRDGRLTFGHYVKGWMATTVANRPSTQARDEGYLERYLLPAFGSTPLGQIDPAAVRVLVAELLAKDLAPATVTKAGQILSKIMDDAVADKRINSNPCKGIKLPRDPNPPEMMTIGPPAIAQLADAIDERYRELVLLGCYGGLRIGELLGLTVAEVDPLRRVVNVKRTLVEVEGHLHVHAPKTRAGRRPVPIPAAVAEELAACMVGKHPDDIVFPAPKGGYVRLAAWRQRIWRPATKAVGLNGFRIHDMRHSAVSMWVASGADPRKVATWAGHASVVTVLDRYAHVTPVADDPAIELIDRLARQAQAANAGPAAVAPIR